MTTWQDEMKRLKTEIQNLKDRILAKENRLKVLEMRVTLTSGPLVVTGCRKTIYPSKIEAKKDMQKINATMSDRAKQIERVYFCEQCGGWHLTSKKQWTEEKTNK